MYDELIKRLRETPSIPVDAKLHNEAADAIDELSHIQIAPEKIIQTMWIPVTERLPDNQCDVLCDDEGRVVVGYYTDEEVGWHDLHIYKIYPTHWMPLPEPPKDGES